MSANAHIITQYHRTLDKVTERFLGKRQIGTTGRGIGPAYADKINRVGIRIQDLFDENILRQKVEGALHSKNHLLVKVYNRRAIGVDEIVDDLLSYADRLRPMVADTALLLNKALDDGKTVVFEGGQATMLDVDHGTYPFVTSSSSTSGRRGDGLGRRAQPAGPDHRHREGLHDPRRRGPVPDRAARRVGRAAALGRLRVRHHHGPPAPHRLVRRPDHALLAADQRRHRLRADEAGCADRHRADPGVRRVRGGRRAPSTTCPCPSRTSTTRCRSTRSSPAGTRTSRAHASSSDLPKNAQDYVLALEGMSGSRISAIGVGPDREAIVVRHDLLP